MNAVLLPVPRRIEWSTERFHFPDQGLIVLDSVEPQSLLPAGAVIEKALWNKMRLNWEVNASTAVPQEKIKIHLRHVPEKDARSQSYSLKISSDIIILESKTTNGLFYAAQTLAQLIGQFGRDLPGASIEDWPDFESRGVMLDISRDKVVKNETLYDLVDRLASVKINQIQLYTEHTYAYHNHPDVWKEASPMTGEEILALDRYCRERFIELVPNQNSFGHMTRWLKHQRYAPLAEIQGEFTVPWGTMSGPFSLAPEEPGSLDLIYSLYDELLPQFTSQVVNIGCDETFDLGAGKSKTICEQRGVGNVYLDFLLKLYENLKKRGYTVQFWGDIILQHPELVEKLPKDMIALEWGYESDHPFAKHARLFAASGLTFYVCPGTSAWNSIAGRTDNALKNLLSAAENGKENHAVGYLNTDWGDNGHWQALPVSFLGYAMGAAYSWCVESNKDLDVREALSRSMFDDPSGIMGKLFYELGNVHLLTGVELSNSSLLFELFHKPLEEIKNSNRVSVEALKKVQTAIDEIMEGLRDERMTRTDAELIRSEAMLTARMLKHACQRVMTVTEESNADNFADLGTDLSEIMDEYRRIWLIRNRVGGLTDSMRKMKTMLAEYR